MAERSTTPERKCKRAKASDRIGQLTDFQSTTRSAAKNDRCRLGTVETNRNEEANKFTCMQMSRPPPLRSLPRWIPQLASAVEMMATFCLWNGIETEWFAVSDWLASDGLWLVNLSTCHPHITAVTMASRQDGNHPQTPVGDPRKNPQKNLPESEFINQSVELNVTVATIIKKNSTTFKWFRTMEPMICSVIILLIFELGWLLLAFVLTS